MYAQTPLSRTKEIDRLARRIVPGGIPVFVPVTPVPDAEVCECFSNVKGHVGKHGGAPQYGWCIYVWPRVWMEMEFHCVWRKTNGKLVDITPHHDNESVLLFLPDPSREYKGLSLDNLRFSLCKNPLVNRMIALGEKKMAIRNEHPIPNEIAIKAIAQVEDDMNQIISQLHWRPERNDPCPCGSRKKVKQCCSQ